MRHRGLRPTLCFLLLLATTSRASPTQAPPPPGWSDFSRLFEEETARDGIVGAVSMFVRSGQIIARQDHGLADRELNQRVDARTLFHWGSITKTLTAIAVMQLVERKRISLDDPIVR